MEIVFWTHGQLDSTWFHWLEAKSSMMQDTISDVGFGTSWVSNQPNHIIRQIAMWGMSSPSLTWSMSLNWQEGCHHFGTREMWPFPSQTQLLHRQPLRIVEAWPYVLTSNGKFLWRLSSVLHCSHASSNVWVAAQVHPNLPSAPTIVAK